MTQLITCPYMVIKANQGLPDAVFQCRQVLDERRRPEREESRLSHRTHEGLTSPADDAVRGGRGRDKSFSREARCLMKTCDDSSN